MFYPFLPKLVQTDDTGRAQQVVLPHSVGNWDDHPGDNRLRHIAEAIDLPTGVEQVHSIPDPWARPILFWRALFDAAHPLHAKIKGEWRGTMALIGLRDIRQYSGLIVRAVNLAANTQGRSDFRDVIAKLPPPDVHALKPGASWRQFHILRWTGRDQVARAFAMSSPYTLVATGADYRGVFSDNNVPWFKEGILTDPRSYLSPTERSLLAEWLLHVMQDLAAKGATLDHIETCLRSFAEDLDPNAHGLVPAAQVFADRMLGFADDALISVLDRPAKPAAQVLTNCAIRGDRADAPLLVLIDDSASMHAQPMNVTVFNMITMATVRNMLPASNGGAAQARGRFATSDGSEVSWCTADFFFEKCMLYEEVVSLGPTPGADLDAFPGCRPVRSAELMSSVKRHAVLPIRPEVLELLSPNYLERCIEVEWLPSGKCTVRLTLDLVTLDIGGQQYGGPRSIILEHAYDPADMVRIQSLPAVCLWPNFCVTDGSAQGTVLPDRWKRYYLFESWRGLAGDDNKFSVAPLGAALNVREIQTPAEFSGQSEEKCSVTVLDGYPEALACTVESGDMALPGRPRTKATGLLLLKAPKTIGASSVQNAVLGVDFGTTGTAIYSAVGGNSPSRMVFRDHMLPITATDPNEFIRITRDWFLPFKQPMSGQILSVFQDFGGDGNRQVVCDGHVLYLQDVAGAGFVHGEPNQIRTNLKWRDDPQVNLASQDFLVQLCLQSLAELVPAGVNAVKICYSYPTAFSDSDLGRLSTLWNSVLIKLRQITSVTVTLDRGSVDNCEAIAAARYFASGKDAKNLVAGRGAISLDIGGGTTDVAVWNRDAETMHPALLAHLSIKFAGQDIFLEALRRNPTVLSVISNGDPEIAGSIQAIQRYRDSTSAYNAEIDAIISRFGERLLHNLPAYAETPGVRDLLQIIGLGLDGLAYYVGLQLGRLVETGVYLASNNRVPVFVGGNGARLFQWCGDGMLAERFGDSLLAGINFACNGKLNGFDADVTLTGRPKEEVAFGLVMPTNMLDRKDGDVIPLAGENYWLGIAEKGDWQTWDKAPNFNALGGKPIMVDPDLKIFRQFLGSVRHTMTDDEHADVVAAVDHAVDEMCRDARQLNGQVDGRAVRDPVRKLPLFILALRGLVGVKIRAFAGHNFSNPTEVR